jgi:tetratricopeptide (TPR) repeat protein
MAKSKSKTGLRCLSIQQPFAWLVCANAKKVENRSWSTDFRGTIAIHASTKQTNVRSAERESESGLIKLKDFAFGAIIGLADIQSIDIYRREFEADGHACGPYCWKMTNGRLLKEPIPMMGKLSLYRLDPEIEAKVLASETYCIDLTEGTKHAIIAREFEPEPEPYFNYQYCIDELSGKLPPEALMNMANRMVELEPNLFEAQVTRFNTAMAMDDRVIAASCTESMRELVLANFGEGENDAHLKIERDAYLDADAGSEGEDNEESEEEEIDEEFNDADEDSEFDETPETRYNSLIHSVQELGYMLLSLEKSEDALPFFERLLTLEPSNKQFLINRGLLHMIGRKDIAAAIEDFKLALKSVEEDLAEAILTRDEEWVTELEHSKTDLNIQLARAYRRGMQFELASDAIEFALSRNPDNPHATLNAGLIAEEKKDFEKAREFANRTIELGGFVEEATQILERVKQTAGDSKPSS